MPSDYIFVPCDQVHNPPMQPHGRIVHTSSGYDECDCSRGGILIRCLDSAEALFEVLEQGGLIASTTKCEVLATIRAHGVPKYIIPNGMNPHTFHFVRRMYANGGHKSFWNGLMGALEIPRAPLQ